VSTIVRDVIQDGAGPSEMPVSAKATFPTALSKSASWDGRFCRHLGLRVRRCFEHFLDRIIQQRLNAARFHATMHADWNPGHHRTLTRL
jgi:hypothetical protein